jgi:hypothetical protein
MAREARQLLGQNCTETKIPRVKPLIFPRRVGGGGRVGRSAIGHHRATNHAKRHHKICTAVAPAMQTNIAYGSIAACIGCADVLA